MSPVGLEPWLFTSLETTLPVVPAGNSVNCLRRPSSNKQCPYVLCIMGLCLPRKSGKECLYAALLFASLSTCQACFCQAKHFNLNVTVQRFISLKVWSPDDRHCVDHPGCLNVTRPQVDGLLLWLLSRSCTYNEFSHLLDVKATRLRRSHSYRVINVVFCRGSYAY